MLRFMQPKWFERIPRTIAKTITWRSWMMVTNSLIGWVVTGDPWKGLAVGLLALVINSTLYILHERLWNRFDWAKKETTRDQKVFL
ncbi:uncharacterized protein METZ01_LOCUS338170 [marine metagenome]|uniref:DUF2061 domain-containing protein n=1 Tax=marine metagenome TaxID=408172 RepID=A0A382QIQ5_9ZZZZ